MEREFNFGSTPESSPDIEGSAEKKEKKSKKKSLGEQARLSRAEAKPDEKSSKAEREPTKKELAKEFLDHKAQDLRSQLASEASNKTEIEADLELVNAISEKIENPEKEVDNAVEEAYAELMEALELEGLEFAEENEPDATEEHTEGDEDEALPPHPSTPASAPATPPPLPPNPPASPPNPPSGPPPTPPAIPAPPPPRRPAPSLPPTPAPMTAPNRFNTAPSVDPEIDERRRVVGKMLVAGVVGYMIGRRGGRKRTEARLNPEIKRRDVTIEGLEKKVAAKEKLVRDGVFTRAPAETTPIAPPPQEVVTKIERTPARGIEERTLIRPELVLPRKETSPFTTRIEKVEVRPIPKHIEQISTPDLLAMAEKITVLDTSIRKLYETNQIDRQGLEEIVKEHLAGHDIGPVLDKRLLGAEAIRDRAHEYRHDPAKDDSVTSTAADEPEAPHNSDSAHDSPKRHTNQNDHTQTAHQLAIAQKAAKSEQSKEPQSPNRAVALTLSVAVAIALALLLVRILFSN